MSFGVPESFLEFSRNCWDLLAIYLSSVLFISIFEIQKIFEIHILFLGSILSFDPFLFFFPPTHFSFFLPFTWPSLLRLFLSRPCCRSLAPSHLFFLCFSDFTPTCQFSFFLLFDVSECFTTAPPYPLRSLLLRPFLSKATRVLLLALFSSPQSPKLLP